MSLFSPVRAFSAPRNRIIASSFLSLLFAASAAFSQPDVMMRDCIADNGDIVPPGYNCGSFYYSPDVWIRQNNDGGTIDQAAIVGQTAYVNVTLRNRGNATSSCGVLSVYYLDPTPTAANWPTHWINFTFNGIIRGDVVGHRDVCAMAPGETRTLVVPWHNVPANIGVHHCLLVRWIASDDPMQTPEGVNVSTNVFGNNNVVHRNCQPTIPGVPNTPVVVFNTRNREVTTSLRLDVLQTEDGENVFEDIPGFAVKLTFDDATFDRWMAAGGDGDNIRAIHHERAVIVEGPDASIDGLTIPEAGDEGYSEIIVGVEMLYPTDLPALNGKRVWTMEQHDVLTAVERAEYEAAGQPIPFDGVAFEIYTSDPEEGDLLRRGVAPTMDPSTALPDLSARPDLKARPNILKESTEIAYTLVEAAKVTLVIHDINGRPVRTLISDANVSAGSHQIEWDGKAADGTLVPGGTYFYRLITPDGAVEQQLKIAR